MVTEESDRPHRRDHDGWHLPASRRDLYEATGVDVRFTDQIESRRRVREAHEEWVRDRIKAEEEENRRIKDRRQKSFIERHAVVLGVLFAALSFMWTVWSEIEKWLFAGVTHHV